MTTKEIDYETWRVRGPRNLEAGEHWSKESHVHTLVGKLKVGDSLKLVFRNVKKLREIVYITNMYLGRRDAHEEIKEENFKRYLQEADEANMRYTIRRLV